jgi:hypothetical protein
MLRYTPRFEPFCYFMEIDMVLGIYSLPEETDLPLAHVALVPRPLLLRNPQNAHEEYAISETIQKKWQISQLFFNDFVDNKDEFLYTAFELTLSALENEIYTLETIKDRNSAEQSIIIRLLNNAFTDPQRKNLYIAEDTTLNHLGKTDEEFIKKLIHDIARKYGIEDPEIQRTGRTQYSDALNILLQSSYIGNMALYLTALNYLSHIPSQTMRLLGFGAIAALFWFINHKIDQSVKDFNTAHYSRETRSIDFNKVSLTRHIACHEMAHAVDHMTQYRAFFSTGHGARFVQIYKNILFEFTPENYQGRVKKFSKELEKRDLDATRFMAENPHMALV